VEVGGNLVAITDSSTASTLIFRVARCLSDVGAGVEPLDQPVLVPVPVPPRVPSRGASRCLGGKGRGQRCVSGCVGDDGVADGEAGGLNGDAG